MVKTLTVVTLVPHAASHSTVPRRAHTATMLVRPCLSQGWPHGKRQKCWFCRWLALLPSWMTVAVAHATCGGLRSLHLGGWGLDHVLVDTTAVMIFFRIRKKVTNGDSANANADHILVLSAGQRKGARKDWPLTYQQTASSRSTQNCGQKGWFGLMFWLVSLEDSALGSTIWVSSVVTFDTSWLRKTFWRERSQPAPPKMRYGASSWFIIVLFKYYDGLAGSIPYSVATKANGPK